MWRWVLMLILLPFLATFEEGKAAATEPVRVIESLVIKAPARQQFRRLSGIVEINSDGHLKIKVMVAEGIVHHLKIGDSVEVRFPTILEEHSGEMTAQIGSGRIIKIVDSASAAHSYPVIIRLTSIHPEAEPGITVDIGFEFTTTATGAAFMLPVSAVLATADQRSGVVFVFDEKENVVRKRAIKLEVMGEIIPGDIVAVAGVSFLQDNMKVILLNPPTTQ